MTNFPLSTWGANGNGKWCPSPAPQRPLLPSPTPPYCRSVSVFDVEPCKAQPVTLCACAWMWLGQAGELALFGDRNGGGGGCCPNKHPTSASASPIPGPWTGPVRPCQVAFRGVRPMLSFSLFSCVYFRFRTRFSNRLNTWQATATATKHTHTRLIVCVCVCVCHTHIWHRLAT